MSLLLTPLNSDQLYPDQSKSLLGCVGRQSNAGPPGPLGPTGILPFNLVTFTDCNGDLIPNVAEFTGAIAIDNIYFSNPTGYFYDCNNINIDINGSRFYVTTGNIGIGTNAPQNILDVARSNTSAQFQVFDLGRPIESIPDQGIAIPQIFNFELNYQTPNLIGLNGIGLYDNGQNITTRGVENTTWQPIASGSLDLTPTQGVIATSSSQLQPTDNIVATSDLLTLNNCIFNGYLVPFRVNQLNLNNYTAVITSNIITTNLNNVGNKYAYGLNLSGTSIPASMQNNATPYIIQLPYTDTTVSNVQASQYVNTNVNNYALAFFVNNFSLLVNVVTIVGYFLPINTLAQDCILTGQLNIDMVS